MTESDKQRAERIAKKLEEIAQNMGNDGYCAYEPCRQYLRQAYELGRRETVEECAKLVEGLWEKEHSIILSDECDYAAHEVRALLPAATREETHG